MDRALIVGDGRVGDAAGEGGYCRRRDDEEPLVLHLSSNRGLGCRHAGRGQVRTWTWPCSIGTRNDVSDAGSVMSAQAIPNPVKARVISSGGAPGPSPLSRTAKRTSVSMSCGSI